MAGDWRLPVSRGELPTRHLLRAAVRAARLLPLDGTDQDSAWNSYGAVGTGGIYTRKDLHTGEGILTSAGLLERSGDDLIPDSHLHDLVALPTETACNEILRALLGEVEPVWLIAATSDGLVEEELVPDSALRELGHLDPQDREEMLLALGRKFSNEDRERTGALAEEALCEELRQALRRQGAEHLADAVRRVSLESDDLGYDITTPRISGPTLRVESKGTRGAGPIWRVFISRNEARQARIDPSWIMVVSAVSPDDEVRVIGWIGGVALQRFFPRDTEPVGVWTTAELRLEFKELTPGVPRV
jgi:hypothetical protein